MPLKFHEASGAMDKDPQRFRDRQEEPMVDAELGGPPAEWVTRAETSPENRKLLAAWEEITAGISYLPQGIVTAADRLAVKLACRLHVRIEGGYAKSSEISQYRAVLSDLCLTVRGRAQRQGPAAGETEDGEFADYARKRARSA